MVNVVAGSQRRQLALGEQHLDLPVLVDIRGDHSHPFILPVRSDPLSLPLRPVLVLPVKDPAADDEFRPSVTVNVEDLNALCIADPRGHNLTIPPRPPRSARIVGNVIVADDLAVLGNQYQLGIAVVVHVGKPLIVVFVVVITNIVAGPGVSGILRLFKPVGFVVVPRTAAHEIEASVSGNIAERCPGHDWRSNDDFVTFPPGVLVPVDPWFVLIAAHDHVRMSVTRQVGGLAEHLSRARCIIVDPLMTKLHKQVEGVDRLYRIIDPGPDSPLFHTEAGSDLLTDSMYRVVYPNPSVGFVVSHQHSVTDAIQFADMEGFDHIEIKMHGDANRKRLERSEDELMSLIAAANLSLLVHLPYQLDIGSPHGHVRNGSVRELEECLECAAAMGTRKAVVHAESRAWLGDDLAANVFDSIDHLQRYATDLGVELCVENPLRGTVPIDDFDGLLEAVETSMTLDTGHARCDGLDSTEIAAFVAKHRERISHVHLNDTRGESDDHLPFGDGTIDFAAIFEAFGEDWDGTVSLEVKTTELKDIARSRQRLERLLAV